MRLLMKLGLVRGLLTGTGGVLVGMGVVMGIRGLMGLPAWKADPVTAAGAAAGVIAFLAGVGAFAPWWDWLLERERPARHGPPPGMPFWTRYFDFDQNHKVIGLQYFVATLLLMAFAGVLALLIRLELWQPDMQFLSMDAYNTTVGLHGIIMIAVILIGIAGMANYLLPLMLGAQDMAFPWLNALSFWLIPPAGLLLLTSMFTGGFSTGWTGYPPLGVRAPMGAQFFYLGVFVLGFSSILGSINMILTILRLRAPGMGLFRMPIFAWAMLATSIIQLVATQFIAMAFLMVVAERLIGIGFFDPARGGSAILFQHIFWFYSHPVVYVFVLPGFGIISELLPVFARKPLFGYRWVALASIGIAFVGFLVWAHHMFTTGLALPLQIVFMFSTLLVAVPTGVKIFSWLGTIWGGKLSFETPMLFTLGAVVIFLVGGLTGPFLALVPTDLFLHETYWVVAHFHQTMFGGYMFPLMAAIYYWFPKVTGYRYKERLGKVHFGLMLTGFVMMTLSMYAAGLRGMLRRIADYKHYAIVSTLAWLNVLASIGGLMVALSIVLLAVNLIGSLRAREPAPANPWRARSLEWQVSSPPPEENFAQPPVIVGGPYDYGVPGSVYAELVKAGHANLD